MHLIEAKKIPKELDFFVDLIKKSKDFDDAYNKAKTTKGIPQETADLFFSKYAGGEKIPQKDAFRNLYNDVMGMKEEIKLQEKQYEFVYNDGKTKSFKHKDDKEALYKAHKDKKVIQVIDQYDRVVWDKQEESVKMREGNTKQDNERKKQYVDAIKKIGNFEIKKLNNHYYVICKNEKNKEKVDNVIRSVRNNKPKDFIGFDLNFYAVIDIKKRESKQSLKKLVIKEDTQINENIILEKGDIVYVSLKEIDTKKDGWESMEEIDLGNNKIIRINIISNDIMYKMSNKIHNEIKRSLLSGKVKGKLSDGNLWVKLGYRY